MVKQNLEDIRRRIGLACRPGGRGWASYCPSHKSTGRSPEEIALLAVTKGRGLGEIKEAINCGISDIGENRLQEALLKYEGRGMRDEERGTRWHMIGHLQTNKVKEAVRIFDLIQSVDSLRLAQAISNEAGKIDKQQDILLEVKTSPEESKFGLKPEDTFAVFQKISQLPHLNIKGLMTIAPFTDNPETSRLYFKMLKELSGKIDWRLGTGDRRPILSMGMSGDFEIAIEEGATMVRLGRAIFQ